MSGTSLALAALLPMLAAAAPFGLMLLVVRWAEPHEPEPLRIILAASACGCFVVAAEPAIELAFEALGLGGLAVPVGASNWTVGAKTLSSLLRPPLVEEFLKGLALILLLRTTRHYDGIVDGFVYGAAIGLGFGISEQFFVVFLHGPSTAADLSRLEASNSLVWMLLVRGLYTGVMHCMSTALMGAVMGAARFRGALWMSIAVVGGLALATAVHAFWNGLLHMPGATAEGLRAFRALDMLLLPFEVAIVALLYHGALQRESVLICRHLAAEAAEGTLPVAHVGLMAAWFGRKRALAAWSEGQEAGPRIDCEVWAEGYIEHATMLAMRRHHKALAVTRGVPRWLEWSYDKHRREVRELVAVGSAGRWPPPSDQMHSDF